MFDWLLGRTQTRGFLMPDGTLRPVPPYLDKPQYAWTEDERAQHAAFQQVTIEMQRRLAYQEPAE
jgi:hypothetical protein